MILLIYFGERPVLPKRVLEVMIRSGTVVLLLAQGQGEHTIQQPVLLETLSDDQEVEFVEAALQQGHPDPVWAIRQRRIRKAQADEEFADYVEGLVCRPECGLALQEHAVHWFESRWNLEQFQVAEIEARQVIAEFALSVFMENPSQTDFLLKSSRSEAQVRVRILWVPDFSSHRESA